ncbi:epithelial sodium channel subunit delta [Pelodytes ibericus]
MESSSSEKTKEGLMEFYDSFNEMFQFFCDNTTIHGTVRLICSRKNKMKTSFWVVLYICTFAIMYWQFGLLTNEYWAYPTSTTINMNSRMQVYPAVTICNLNPYRFDQVNEHVNQLDRIAQETLSTLYGYNASFTKDENMDTVDLGDILDNLPSPENETFHLNYRIRLVKLQENGQDLATPEQEKYRVGFKLCDQSGEDCYYRSFWSGVDALHEWYKFHFMNIMSKIPLLLPITKQEIMRNFIISCEHAGYPCSERAYIHFHHPIYGNCFTLNSQGNKSLWNVNSPGKKDGMTLTVKTDQKDNMPLLSTSAGARVMIHNPFQPPLVEHEGFDIWPGTETSISISQDQVNRLDGVYSECTANGRDVGFKLLYNSSYTLQACLHSCFQYIMIETCGCGYYFYPLAPGAEYCDYNKHPGWGHCFYRLYDKLLEHRLSCFTKCPKQCKETIYQLSAGTAKWPSSNSKKWVIPLLALKNGYNITSNRSEVSKINLYFRALSHRSFDEVPAMPVTLMLSNMGGQWALWFGSSVLSVAELAELVFDVSAMLIIIAYRWKRQTKSKPQEGSPATPTVNNTATATDEKCADTEP